MVGDFLIDNVDVYTRYGVILKEGGLNSLLSLPSTKNVTSNDWEEYNFVEPDLSKLRLSSKSILLTLHSIGDTSDMVGLCTLINGKVTHVFNFASIGLSKTLRVVSCKPSEYKNGISTISLSVVDDSPLGGYTYKAPTLARAMKTSNYSLDNKPFSNYGICVLRGSLFSALGNGDVKTPLVRDVSVVDGSIVDSSITSRLRSNDISLHCLLRSSTYKEAWDNLNAFLYDLIKVDNTHATTEECMRTLKIGSPSKTIKCYYKSGSALTFHPDDGRVWLEFTLVLHAIG